MSRPKNPPAHSEIYYVGNGVDDNTQLWRYMRLSTLLMLLNGKVFIPTINTLRKDDPAEAHSLCRKTWERFKALTAEDRVCLLDHATRSQKTTVRLNPSADHSRLFSQVWRQEMGERRCAWCWHAADIESMAQWHIYAKDGVAIGSTPKRIRSAFGEYAVDSGLIGQVQYENEDSNDATYLRPYLIKRRCYQHEKEVRVIFPREPTDAEGGLYLPINARELISQIRISPLLPHGEALGLRSALEQYVNRSEGVRFDDLDLTQIGISDLKDISGSLLERFEFFTPKKTGISNFGKVNMPFLFSDDIRRGLSTRSTD